MKYNYKIKIIIWLPFLFMSRTDSLKINTYIDFWCEEPMKVIDLQDMRSNLQKLEFHKKEAEGKCSVWLKNIPNNYWTANSTRVFRGSLNNTHVMKISDGLKKLDESFFSMNIKLRYLDLSGNNLNHLMFPTKQTIPISFSLLDYLRGLDLSKNDFNNITFIKQEISLLEELDLSENKLKEISIGQLHYLPNLNTLILAKNNIENFTETTMIIRNLDYLDLSSNNIENLNFLKNFGNLKVFTSNNNYFPTLTSNLLKPEIWSLKELQLKNNQIEYISRKAFINFPNLKKLWLSHNKISNLYSEIFYGLDNLEYLDISHNFIQDFDSDIFISQKKLYHLNLVRNQISNLDFTSLVSRLSSLREIDLMENSFNCEYFKNMISYFETFAIDIRQESCLFEDDFNEKCCKSNSSERYTTTTVVTEEVHYKLNQKELQLMRIISNNTSENIARYLSKMEQKTDSYHKLILYQFAYIAFITFVFLIVMMFKYCGRSERRHPVVRDEATAKMV